MKTVLIVLLGIWLVAIFVRGYRAYGEGARRHVEMRNPMAKP